jgi:hypothetical protein
MKKKVLILTTAILSIVACNKDSVEDIDTESEVPPSIEVEEFSGIETSEAEVSEAVLENGTLARYGTLIYQGDTDGDGASELVYQSSSRCYITEMNGTGVRSYFIGTVGGMRVSNLNTAAGNEICFLTGYGQSYTRVVDDRARRVTSYYIPSTHHILGITQSDQSGGNEVFFNSGGTNGTVKVLNYQANRVTTYNVRGSATLAAFRECNGVTGNEAVFSDFEQQSIFIIREASRRLIQYRLGYSATISAYQQIDGYAGLEIVFKRLYNVSNSGYITDRTQRITYY